MRFSFFCIYCSKLLSLRYVFRDSLASYTEDASKNTFNLYVKCPLFLYNLNQNRNVSIKFSKAIHNRIS